MSARWPAGRSTRQSPRAGIETMEAQQPMQSSMTKLLAIQMHWKQLALEMSLLVLEGILLTESFLNETDFS